MRGTSRLYVRQYPVRWQRARPVLRRLVTLVLVGSLVVGAARWLNRSSSVGALEFTPHAVGIETGAKGVRDVQVRDMDGDGDREIITAGQDGVKIYVNEGSLNFSVRVVDDKDSERFELADLDRDGDIDLLVTFRGDSPSVRWYENTGDLEYTAHTIATAGADAVASAGDLNADGYTDIVVASGRDTIILERWMNSGSGTFTATTVSSDSGVTAVTVADVTHNGYEDIVTGGSDGLQRWTTQDGLTWTRFDIDDSQTSATYIATGDPGEGKTWIVTANAPDDETNLYRSGPTGTTDTTYRLLALDDELDAHTVATADLDSDGDLDVLLAAQDDNGVYWFKNDGMDHFTREIIATGLAGVYGVTSGDMDGDDDLDVVMGDPLRGTVYVYERLHVKPVATSAGDISQSMDGLGVVTFSTTLSDGDSDPTRIRVQYSIDGEHWYKPWLTSATVDSGSIDLNNENGYQIGTRDAIDTDAADSVKVTMVWDTKSVENTGGPIIGDSDTVQIRILPRDDREGGVVAISDKFRVDNAPPSEFTLTLDEITSEQASLSWTRPKDKSAYIYQLYYGTDHGAVLDQTSDQWGGSDESSLDDVDTTTATITGLEADKLYSFKLFVTDVYGNLGAASSVRGKTVDAVVVSPSPGLDPTPSVLPSDDPVPTTTMPLTSDVPTPTTTIPTVSPTAEPTATPTPEPVLEKNNAPVADAGPDQVVNPRALVILNGAASFDPDIGDTATLTYTWRQISGQKIDLLSDRTATPSFSAGSENETYVFSLTIKDLKGASAVDTVTIATKALPPPIKAVPVIGISEEEEIIADESSWLTSLLKPADIFLLISSIISTLVLVADRVGRSMRDESKTTLGQMTSTGPTQSRVVHYSTGEPIAGAQVLVYGEDGKLRAQERTNNDGVFATFFPPGKYTLGVRAEGFTFAPAGAKLLGVKNSVFYSGGIITVKDSGSPPTVVIPLKPTGGEITSLRIRSLHIWQITQRMGRALSWPLFLSGALMNTVLVFFDPSFIFLGIELLYVGLVIIKIVLEVNVRPAYGVVRDAITHIPLDLAVVRLYGQGTNRLIMTRVTNSQGKFFALPPAGVYTVTITKPGYGTFSKENVEMKSEQDSSLKLTAELMPVVPTQRGGLSQARAATI